MASNSSRQAAILCSRALSQLAWLAQQPSQLATRAGAACAPTSPLEGQFAQSNTQQWSWGYNLTFAAGSKGQASGKGKGGKLAAKLKPDPNKYQYNPAPFEKEMQQAIEQYQADLANIRTGQANPNLIANLDIKLGDRNVPLQQIATIVVRSPQLLAVTCHNPEAIKAVETSIKSSQLKLQARAEKTEVLVPIPRPSGDAIKQLVKLIAAEGEKSRNKLRQSRNKCVELAQKAFSSEDELHRWEQEIQKMFNKYSERVDQLKKAKEKELEANA